MTLSKTETMNTKIAIIGGGLSGLSMACLLGQHNINCVVIEGQDYASMLTEEFDGRTTAISYGSHKVLQEAGVWDKIASEACPITSIDILDGDNPSILNFDANDVQGRPFGWILENLMLRRALYKTAKENKNITIIAPTSIQSLTTDTQNVTITLQDSNTVIEADLLIGADGRGSFVRNYFDITDRQWSYGQSAVICCVEHDHPHNGLAVEHFRPEGPFAILPMTDSPEGKPRSSVVWTIHEKTGSSKQKKSPLHYNEDIFNTALTTRFPEQYGNVLLSGKRFSYPLGLIHAHRYTGERMALIADAAHGIHPIAGQGLNLGYKDIAALFDLLQDSSARDQDLGSDEILKKYERARRLDNMLMAGTTDGLNKLFSNDNAAVRLARQTGLKAVSNLPFAKKFFMKQAMGVSGIVPQLMKG